MGDENYRFCIIRTWKIVRIKFLKFFIFFIFLNAYMALGSLLFFYVEHCYDVVKEEWSSVEKSLIDLCNNITKFNQTTSNIITINMSNDNKAINNNTEPIGMVTYMKDTCQKMQPVKNDVVCDLTFLLFCKYYELACTICFTIG